MIARLPHGPAAAESTRRIATDSHRAEHCHCPGRDRDESRGGLPDIAMMIVQAAGPAEAAADSEARPSRRRRARAQRLNPTGAAGKAPSLTASGLAAVMMIAIHVAAWRLFCVWAPRSLVIWAEIKVSQSFEFGWGPNGILI